MGTTGAGSVAAFDHAALHSGPRIRLLPFISDATRCAVTRRRCGTGTDPHPATARRSAAAHGYELREDRHTRGWRANPRRRPDRHLAQPGVATGVASGPVGPIHLRPATYGNPTLRGRTVNRTPAKRSHSKILGSVSSPREKSPSVLIRAAMTMRIILVPFCPGTLARQHLYHVRRQGRAGTMPSAGRIYCPPVEQVELKSGLAIPFSMWQCAGHGDAAGSGFVR